MRPHPASGAWMCFPILEDILGLRNYLEKPEQETDNVPIRGSSVQELQENHVLPGSHGSRIKNSRQLVSQSTTQFGELHLAKYFWPVFVACQMYSPQTGRQNHGTKGTRGTSRSLHCTRHPGATSSPMIHIDIFIFFEHDYVFMCFDIFKYIYIYKYIYILIFIFSNIYLLIFLHIFTFSIYIFVCIHT